MSEGQLQHAILYLAHLGRAMDTYEAQDHKELARRLAWVRKAQLERGKDQIARNGMGREHRLFSARNARIQHHLCCWSR
jgi:hypothetical protein